jgi:hypothetical protein
MELAFPLVPEGKMNETRTIDRTQNLTPRYEHPTPPKRRVVAVGRRQNGRWKVRTSLWRYLLSTGVSQ